MLLIILSAEIHSAKFILPNGTVSEMVFYETTTKKTGGAATSFKPFYFDKSPVTQKTFRVFDPAYIQRIKELCDNCPVTDITDSEKEKFCAWAGKRMPTANELKMAEGKKESGFRCAADESHIKASRKPKESKPSVTKYTKENLFKGGTCEPKME